MCLRVFPRTISSDSDETLGFEYRLDIIESKINSPIKFEIHAKSDKTYTR